MASNKNEPMTEVAMETIDNLAENNVDSTDTSARYMAYGARLRTALRSAHRYLAYVCVSAPLATYLHQPLTLRPVTLANLFVQLSRRLLCAAHMAFRGSILLGVFLYFHIGFWAYVYRDVSYETYKAKKRGPTAVEAANFSETTRLGMVIAKRATFQSIASMHVLPAIITLPCKTKSPISGPYLRLRYTLRSNRPRMHSI
jgi:mitochondrial fission process protein 1